jgi:hypothetical protein
MIQHFTFTTVAAVTIEASSETEARTLLRHSAQYQEIEGGWLVFATEDDFATWSRQR